MDERRRKRALRRGMVARILAIDPAERRRQEAELAARFADLPGLGPARTVLLYASAFPEEIDTRPMLRHALDSGKRLACPRVDRARGILTLHAIDDPECDFRPGTLGIPEPAPHCDGLAPDRIDWVLAPGLAFDDRGYRLGRGAGHYDRLLPMLRPDVPRWALAFDEQWIEALPVEPHDQPLDGVASPARVAVRARRGRE